MKNMKKNLNMKINIKEDMMNPDIDWKETNSLAGLFQKIVEDCKNSLPLYDELLTKSSKLQSQLHSITTVFGSFLETVQKIADSAYNSKGSSTDLGICLTRIVLRHRALEDHIKTVARCLFHCCSLPIQGAKEEWRKKVLQMDKEHSKQFKKMRILLKKRSESIVKVEKKMKKRKNDPELRALKENLLNELQQQRRNVYEQETKCVKEIGCQERSLYITLAAGLKPVIVEELAMLSEVEQLGKVMEKMDDILLDPYNNSDDKENIMHNVLKCKEYYCFETPPSTPGGSVLSSRTGSLRSINSFSRSSSAANSDSEDQIIFRSRQNSASSQQSYQRSNTNNLKKRNSTLSHQSQDSGFASQDLSFIRQESRKQFQSHSAFSSPIKSHPAKKTTSPYSVHDPSPLTFHGQTPLVISLPYHGQNRLATSLRHNTHNITSLPPRPPKPAVPLRSSSLDRHSCQENSRMNEANSKRPQQNCNDKHFGSESATYEDTKTPTNETLSILDGKQFDFESVSMSSSGYGSYQAAEAVSSHRRTDEISDPGKTLRRPTNHNPLTRNQILNKADYQQYESDLDV